MLSELKWLSHFPIDEEHQLELINYHKSSGTKNEEGSLTWYALRCGIIPQSSYLRWACDHYHLLKLREGCYIQDKKLWLKLPLKSLWKPAFIPIHIWEGTLFIACVEPPSKDVVNKLKRYYDVQFFLSSLPIMDKLWKQLESQRESVEPIETKKAV